MNRRLFSAVLIVFLMVFSAATAFAQPAASGKVHKWKLQCQWPAGSASYKPLKDYFEQTLKSLTGGRLQISVFPGGALVPTKEIFDSCRKGMIEAASVSPTNYTGIMPIAGVATNLPMTFRHIWEGLYFHFVLGFEDMMREAHAQYNLLYYTERLYPTAIICKKPVNRMEDYKGLKMRSSGPMADFLKALGASTSLIPGPDIYLALQTGVVDGAHWGAAAGALTTKLSEVAKYYLQPDLAASTADGIIINKDAFNALPKDAQMAVDLSLRERTWLRTHQNKMVDADALETMKRDYKVQVTTVPLEDQKKMAKLAMKQWDEAGSRDAASGKAVGIMKDFLKKLGHID
jgi:TRAP-type C4-dicarboxylate transport system substrate-binding protein